MRARRIRLAAGAAVAVAAGAVALFGGLSDSTPDAGERVAAARAIDQQASQSLSRLVEGLSTGDTPAFVRSLEAEVARNSSDGQALLELGLAYQQLARETGDPSYFSLSARALGSAREQLGVAPLVLVAEASLAVSQHEFGRAETLARQALEAQPDLPAALTALGDALVNQGRYEEAFAVLDRAAELAPSIGTYSRIAHARELTGWADGALEAIDLGLELDAPVPEHVAFTAVQRGNIELGRGRTAEAERAYREALERYPRYVHAEAGLARVAAARGDYGAAAEQFSSVVDRLPAPAYAIALGDVLDAAGRPAEAARAYELVEAIGALLEANGIRTELQTALFDLDRGHDVAGALERARAAHAEAPSVVAEDVLAWALERNGRCDEARSHSDAALRLGTVDALFLFHRGMIERCLGGEAGAVQWFERALEANPAFSTRWAPLARAAVAAAAPGDPAA